MVSSIDHLANGNTENLWGTEVAKWMHLRKGEGQKSKSSVKMVEFFNCFILTGGSLYWEGAHTCPMSTSHIAAKPDWSLYRDASFQTKLSDFRKCFAPNFQTLLIFSWFWVHLAKIYALFGDIFTTFRIFCSTHWHLLILLLTWTFNCTPLYIIV